jgi:twitching motility protein PilT
MENLETLDPASSGLPLGPPPPPPATRPAPVAQEAAEIPPLQTSGPEGSATIEDLLRYIVDVKASDLHVKAGSPPTIRISGDLHPLDYPTIVPAEASTMAMALLLEEKERQTLEEKGEVDFAYSMSGVGRFRVNVHRQRGSLGIAARRILPGAPNFADLQLPKVVEQLSREHRGLIS